MEHSLEFCLNKRLEFFPLLTTGVQGKSYIYNLFLSFGLAFGQMNAVMYVPTIHCLDLEHETD